MIQKVATLDQMHRAIATQGTPIKARQSIRTARIETAESSVKTGKVGKHSKPVKTATTKSKAMTAPVTAVHTQHMPQYQTAIVKQATSTVTTIVKSLVTSTNNEISRTDIQKTRQTVTRSINHQESTSTQPQVKRIRKQPAIFAGKPDRQTVKKRSARTKTNSISHKVVKFRQKKSSDKNHVSNGLSKEVLAFLKLLREKIEKHRQYPRIAKRLGYQGTTTISFALSHAGDLTLLKVSEPSGHKILDEAALEAVQNVTPLKPPKTIGGTAIEIPVAFELSR